MEYHCVLMQYKLDLWSKYGFDIKWLLDTHTHKHTHAMNKINLASMYKPVKLKAIKNYYNIHIHIISSESLHKPVNEG